MIENSPKISIITVVYNSEKFIKKCLKSVSSQTYENIEHIIIDGCSTDQTLRIIEEHKTEKIKLWSEKDNGIYDAMNKGLAYATGEIIFFLNSDDFFFDRFTVETITQEFVNNQEIDIVMAGIVYFNPENISKKWKEWRVYPGSKMDFTKGWHPPHPGFFARRRCYKEAGLFDINLDVSADFDLMLRFLFVYKFNAKLLNLISTCMYDGGYSSGLKNRIIGNKNIIKSFKKYNIKVNAVAYILRRIIPKIFKRILK